MSSGDSRTVFAATMAGAYRSRDGGDTWQSLTDLEAKAPAHPGSGMPPAFAIVTDPFEPGTVYAGSPRGGVFRSLDGGDSWTQASYGMDPNEGISDFLADPNRPGLIYASTRESGVFYTTDRGQRWTPLADGISQVWVDQMALSEDGSVLYAGTRVSGVVRLGTPVGAPPHQRAAQPDAAEATTQAAESF